MDFTAFDTKKIEDYTIRAKEQWGQTSAYQEYEEKAKGMTDTQQKDILNRFMLIFAEFTDSQIDVYIFTKKPSIHTLSGRLNFMT